MLLLECKAAAYFADLKEMPEGQKPQGLEGSLGVRHHRASSVHRPSLLLHLYGRPGTAEAQPSAHLTQYDCLDFGRLG